MIGRNESDIIDTLRLDEKSVCELCAMLDLHKEETRSHGGVATIPYQSVIGIRCADTQVRRYHVYLREIGPDWCTVLIGLYTHPDQRCTVRLETASGEPHLFEATIETCQHVSGRFHEARLSIESPVSLIELVGSSCLDQNTPDDTNPNDTAAMRIIEARLAEAESLVALTRMLAEGEVDAAWRVALELVREVSGRHGFDGLRDAAGDALDGPLLKEGISRDIAVRLETALRALRPG
ncbi:MAG: hypothetical protein RLN60_02940 [Phycisphaerales bacterium]